MLPGLRHPYRMRFAFGRDTKVMIVDLPAILAAEMTAIPFDSVHWATVSERLCLAHSTVHLLSSGLRAPPVFV